MDGTTRRAFVKQATATATGSAFWLRLARAQGANSALRVAVAGVNNHGNNLANRFQEEPGVDVVALCDPDRAVLARQLEAFKKRHQLADSAISGVADIREILDRQDVDAVVIATPNHWHALMTVWACQAGKHVYVEKPGSHSIWEGRKMIEAARKYNRIVQVGTQARSCPALLEAAADLQAGRWGKILWAHCSRMQARSGIGKVTEPQPPPASVDYNLWAGPAPQLPVMRRNFHYDWHWQWAWGGGETANWGVHHLADLNLLLGWKDAPDRVISAGNRLVWDDNGETPNIHLSLMCHGDLPVVVDVRNLPDSGRRGGNEGAVFLGARDGNYIRCEHASVRMARGGGAAFDHDGKRIHHYKGDGGRGHIPNFIAALRAGSASALNADVEVGHSSAVLCHLANIAWRVGQEAPLEQVRESFGANSAAADALNDVIAQLQGINVDFQRASLKLGPQLRYDRVAERFVGEHADLANAYVRCPHREPFVIRETV